MRRVAPATRPAPTPPPPPPPPRLALVLVLSGVAGAGCVGGGTASGPGGADETTVIVDGSSTVFRISKAAQEAYSDVEPDATVVVDNHGTGGGFGRYLQGEVDLVDASRGAKPDEAAEAAANGLKWTRFVVGYDGITLVVNPENHFVRSFTPAQLRAIWAPGSAVKTWKDIDPTWPDREIVLYSPDLDSGTLEFFTAAVVGRARTQRDDVQQNADDNTLVNGVAGDPDALGYFGYAYYAANTHRLRAVPVRNGPDAPAVLPSPATVLDGSYAPLSRPLYVFARNSSLRKPGVARFVTYYLDHVGRFAEKAGFVAPREGDLAANRAALAAATGRAPAAVQAAD